MVFESTSPMVVDKLILYNSFYECSIFCVDCH